MSSILDDSLSGITPSGFSSSNSFAHRYPTYGEGRFCQDLEDRHRERKILMNHEYNQLNTIRGIRRLNEQKLMKHQLRRSGSLLPSGAHDRLLDHHNPAHVGHGLPGRRLLLPPPRHVLPIALPSPRYRLLGSLAERISPLPLVPYERSIPLPPSIRRASLAPSSSSLALSASPLRRQLEPYGGDQYLSSRRFSPYQKPLGLSSYWPERSLVVNHRGDPLPELDLAYPSRSRYRLRADHRHHLPLHLSRHSYQHSDPFTISSRHPRRPHLLGSSLSHNRLVMEDEDDFSDFEWNNSPGSSMRHQAMRPHHRSRYSQRRRRYPSSSMMLSPRHHPHRHSHRRHHSLLEYDDGLDGDWDDHLHRHRSLHLSSSRRPRLLHSGISYPHSRRRRSYSLDGFDDYSDSDFGWEDDYHHRDRRNRSRSTYYRNSPSSRLDRLAEDLEFRRIERDYHGGYGGGGFGNQNHESFPSGGVGGNGRVYDPMHPRRFSYPDTSFQGSSFGSGPDPGPRYGNSGGWGGSQPWGPPQGGMIPNGIGNQMPSGNLSGNYINNSMPQNGFGPNPLAGNNNYNTMPANNHSSNLFPSRNLNNNNFPQNPMLPGLPALPPRHGSFDSNFSNNRSSLEDSMNGLSLRPNNNLLHSGNNNLFNNNNNNRMMDNNFPTRQPRRNSVSFDDRTPQQPLLLQDNLSANPNPSNFLGGGMNMNRNNATSVPLRNNNNSNQSIWG